MGFEDGSTLSMKKIVSHFKTTEHHTPSVHIHMFPNITYATLSAMVATSVVHPLDLIKTRIQITPFPYTNRQMARRIIMFEGYGALYHGFRAALFRQCTTSFTRYTVYFSLYDVYKKKYNRHLLTTTEKVKIGIVAGLVGGFVGNPSEVVLVRMMASSAPRAFNRCPDLQNLIENRYTGIGNALNRILMEEGIFGLWRGGSLTLLRSVLNTCCQIGVYSYFCDILKAKKQLEGFPLHAVAAMGSSFVFAMVSLPCDVVKTRYQMRRRGITKKQIFNNIVKLRGPLYFWKKPLPPYFTRLYLHTLTSFFVFESIKNCYDKEYHNSKK